MVLARITLNKNLPTFIDQASVIIKDNADFTKIETKTYFKKKINF